jgi:hypothetical protein
MEPITEQMIGQIKQCEQRLSELPKDYIRIALGKSYIYSDKLETKHKCFKNTNECYHPGCVLLKLTKIIDDYYVYSQSIPLDFNFKSENKKIRNLKKNNHTERYLKSVSDKLCISNK